MRLSSIVCCFVMKTLSGRIFVQISEYSEETKEFSSFDDSQISKGDILISNYPSYMDLIYLQYRYTPLFFIPIDDEHVSIKFFHQMFIETLFSPNKDNNNKSRYNNEEALNIAKNIYRAPIILLPEREKTNCCALTYFMNFKGKMKETKVFLIGLKRNNEKSVIEQGKVTTPTFIHFVSMLGIVSNPLEINFCELQLSPNQNEIIMNSCQKTISKLADIPVFTVEKEKIE